MLQIVSFELVIREGLLTSRSFVGAMFLFISIYIPISESLAIADPDRLLSVIC